MKRKLITLAVQAGLAGAVLASPQLASAQEGAVLEEIVVTARKRAESLQNVPIAVTAFTAKEIDRAGIERPQDFIGLTPNVTIVDTANVGDTQVSIRGQVSTRDAESTFAYVVDGVLITNPNGFNGELFDIEQIEVLKGPQGALYGRNAVAGAILVNTKRPGDELEGSIKVGAGDDNLYRGQAMVSGPLVENKLFGRLAFNYRETDGQFTNELTGGDDEVNYHKEQGIRGRLIWEASDRLTFDTQASYRDVEGGAINFNAVFALPGAAEFTGFPELYKDVNDHDFRYAFNTPGENEQETTFFSLKADYEFDGATLTGVLAYDDMEEYLLSDGTSAAFGGYSFGAPESLAACTESFNTFDTSLLETPPFYAIQDGNPPATEFVPEYGGLNALLPPYSPTTCDGYQYQERNQKSTSLEVRLASNDEGRLRWLAGLYYAEIEREVVVAYGADLARGFERAPYIPPDGLNPTDLLFWDDFDTTVYSGFGQVEFDLAERHEVALALRYDEEEREVSNKVPNVLNAQIYGQFGQAPINPAFDGSGTDTIPDRDETFDEWQPKLSYTFSMNDAVSFYGTYGRGFRSGGFNSLGSGATVNGAFGSFDTAPQEINDDYDKEVTDSFEIGLKSEMLDNRLRINAAAFYTEIDDYQFFNFFAGSFGLLRVVTNIDEVELQGAEIDFAYALNEYFTFSGGYGIVDSEIKENQNRPYTEGNDLPMAPESSGALSLDFGAPVGDFELTVRADLQYTGKMWFHSVQENVTTNAFTDLSGVYGVPGFGFGPSDYSRTQRDSYYTVNLRGGISGENWSIIAWSRNVTDEDYLEEIIPAPEFGGSFIHDSAGRVSGVDFTYSF
jgi:iron complex outermembrane receptor protein